MAVAILARQEVTARLGRIASQITGVYPAKTPDELEAVVRNVSVTIVIIDPEVYGTPRIEQLERLIRKSPQLYFILYTSVTPKSLETIVRPSKRGVRDVLTRGVNDSPDLFRAKLVELE